MVSMTKPLLLLTLVALAYSATWNYNSNGADWTGTCASGTSQSPINLPTSSMSLVDGGAAFSFDSNSFSGTRTYSDGYKLIVNDFNIMHTTTNINSKVQDWTSAQFHFHAPAEHEVDGTLHAAEVHFVHFNDDGSGNAMVIGVIFEQDNSAPNIQFLEDLKLSKAFDAQFSLTYLNLI